MGELRAGERPRLTFSLRAVGPLSLYSFASGTVRDRENFFSYATGTPLKRFMAHRALFRLLAEKQPTGHLPSPKLSGPQFPDDDRFSMVVSTMMVFVGLAGEPSTGLPVRRSRLGVEAERTFGIQPLRVRIVMAGPKRAGIYVDSGFVDWDDFGTFLDREASRRPSDWPVLRRGRSGMDGVRRSEPSTRFGDGRQR